MPAIFLTFVNVYPPFHIFVTLHSNLREVRLFYLAANLSGLLCYVMFCRTLLGGLLVGVCKDGQDSLNQGK